MCIYGIIIILGVFSSLLDRIIWKRKDETVLWAAIYSTVYYFVITLFRTLQGNSSDYLSFSFYDKSLFAYIKVTCLCMVTYFIQYVITKKSVNKYLVILENIVAYYIALIVAFIVLVKYPNMKEALVLGIVSIVAYIICRILGKNGSEKKEISIKDRYLTNCSVMLLFVVMHYIVGPTELYAYNIGDFFFSYLDMFPMLCMGAIILFTVVVVITANVLSDREFNMLTTFVSLVCIIGYIQSMFFNGKMTIIDGAINKWSAGIYIINTIIWGILFAIGLWGYYKSGISWGRRVRYICNVIVMIQIVALCFILATTDVIRNQNYELTTKGEFELSRNRNVIVFILDAYDVQMLNKVIQYDQTYLAPLKDFTYYNNVTSMADATDGSLPYILTGIDTSEKNADGVNKDWYRDTHFLRDIANKGYGIRILTECKYVEGLDKKIIDNYNNDGYCILDGDKTVATFLKAMRYKYAPYLLKNRYKYEDYEFTNTIIDTNIYVFGMDDKFNDRLMDEGVSLVEDSNQLRIYHLYGAHAPYYLNEDAVVDYNNSDPIAQWKGCIKIVYNYINQLKLEGIYDNSSIIIMADHGLNRSQRSALDNAGISYNEGKSNPILFIKPANTKKDEMMTISKDASHKQLFDTIMHFVDEDWQDCYSGCFPNH